MRRSAFLYADKPPTCVRSPQWRRTSTLGSLFASGQSSGLNSDVSRLRVSDMIRKEVFSCDCRVDILCV